MRPFNGVEFNQGLEKGLEVVDVHLAGRVAQGFARAGMRFDKQSVDAGAHGGPGQYPEVLTRTPRRIGTRDPVFANRVGYVEYDRIAGLLQMVKRAGIDHQVVVAKSIAPFGQDDFVIAR